MHWYEAPVTDRMCFLQKEEFLVYQEYGKRNEGAQKLLYELEDNEIFNAFFLVSVFAHEAMCRWWTLQLPQIGSVNSEPYSGPCLSYCQHVH